MTKDRGTIHPDIAPHMGALERLPAESMPPIAESTTCGHCKGRVRIDETPGDSCPADECVLHVLARVRAAARL